MLADPEPICVRGDVSSDYFCMRVHMQCIGYVNDKDVGQTRA